jgi:hypothetical protein
MGSASRRFLKILLGGGVLFCAFAYFVLPNLGKDKERMEFAMAYAESHGLTPTGNPEEQFRVWGPFETVYRGQAVFRLSVSKAGNGEFLWFRFGRSGTSIYLVDKNDLRTKLM